MKEVIRIDQEEVNDKPVEFTGYLSDNMGWENYDSDIHNSPQCFDKIIYLGRCSVDGDMFACCNDTIMIYKGHLNSGKY